MLKLNCKPSTNVVLIVLIWKAQINATQARYGRFRSSILSVLMYLRIYKKFKKIPENCCGNLFTTMTTRFDQANESKMMGLNEFVDQVGGAIRNSIVEYANVIEGPNDDEDEFFSKVIMKPQIEISEDIRKGEVDFHIISSVRNFPFYEADLSWGKVAWVSLVQRPHKGILLMDGSSNGDRVEAWVTMDVEDMAYFEKDPNVALFLINQGRTRPKM
ncbi:hypothetical protein Dsin_026740 [Dipteronia sinensis]|uniref:Uncharacterized protein n=1 Tax=Dipteronia sinensis TaxID=43782 RepID=A0AAD9ZYH0_9ROSI|nr:hypothetical protein Dsin_026740 [Dipteronia sinensis]